MSEKRAPSVAIVDYGMGNLFSVGQACRHLGLNGIITTSPDDLAKADGVILPGVGAFADAMESLHSLGLVEPLREIGASDKPLMGVCLGMQLLMSESYEFGRCDGLGIIDGPVVRFEDDSLKVPQVGWNSIYSPTKSPREDEAWSDTLLAELEDGEYMYFVHSFYVKPDDPEVVLAASRYGDVEFCSSLSYKNIFACQFHPERSGPQGLKIYGNLARVLNQGLNEVNQ
jgi:glutamine amidotransferase